MGACFLVTLPPKSREYWRGQGTAEKTFTGNSLPGVARWAKLTTFPHLPPLDQAIGFTVSSLQDAPKVRRILAQMCYFWWPSSPLIMAMVVIVHQWTLIWPSKSCRVQLLAVPRLTNYQTPMQILLFCCNWQGWPGGVRNFLTRGSSKKVTLWVAQDIPKMPPESDFDATTWNP